MAGLCEGGNEPPGSLKASNESLGFRAMDRIRFSSEMKSGSIRAEEGWFTCRTWTDIVYIDAQWAKSCLSACGREISNRLVDLGPSRAVRDKEGILVTSMRKGLLCCHLVVTRSLKMTAKLAAVRSVPGRSLDGTRCRHGCPEIETLAHVLGFCEQGLLLRNSRHHLVRSKIAAALRNKGWIVEEEISCLAKNGSTRRVDILAYNADTKQGIIVDPTIRFEVECHQSAEVHREKKSIYEPTVNYFKLKYALIHVEVFGLLIGARGTIPAFFGEFRRQFALPTSLRMTL
ncbi:hypothetical protein ANN_06149 [Periplaneta americana]|uniref:Uncharacterized protein n=1 Tax=Periplaneta americana TaxID=6978 RepID=A0ABQ8TCR5_PERAM|nr:hypothetical protein ANN_06149 [Periplaneta americana]